MQTVRKTKNISIFVSHIIKLLFLCLVIDVCSATVWKIPESDLSDTLDLGLPFTVSIKTNIPFTFRQDQGEGNFRKHISIEVESNEIIGGTSEEGNRTYSLELDDDCLSTNAVNSGSQALNPTCLISMLATGLVSNTQSSNGLFGLMFSGLACASQVRGQDDDCSGVVNYGLDWCLDSNMLDGDWNVLTFKPTGTCDNVTSSSNPSPSASSDDPTNDESDTNDESGTNDERDTYDGIGDSCTFDSDCKYLGMYCYMDVCAWSSVLDYNSPYFNRSSPLDKHRYTPTSFPADCRPSNNMLTGQGIDMCMRPYYLAVDHGRGIGTGPSLALVFNGHYSGGFINNETSELIVSAYWGSSSLRGGYIVAIHLETGNRRIVSGEFYPDDPSGPTETVGSGDPFPHVLDVKKGPDGMYYAYCDPAEADTHYIARIDPLTGNRELVWASVPTGQENGFPQLYANIEGNQKHLQTNDYGFGILDNGDFMVAVDSSGSIGDGIIRLWYNGTTVVNVSSLSISSDDPDVARGTGNNIRGSLQGYTVKNSKIYGTTITGQYFMEIDIETGDRTTLVNTNGVSGLIGQRWHVYDEAHGMWWTSGSASGCLVVGWERERDLGLTIHKAEPDLFPWFPLDALGPLQVTTLNRGGMWMHPTIPNRMLFAHDSMSIVEFELHTGNSRTLSL
eukprot:TRINITY_DN2013_c0_g3_i2.p1 TRINITY_DN2013_c0_g3~~TRINITY_DN2013_c0_g3_i2.p1  ORF type:complete len:675 (+),score=97.02 TRINITY_DN2013_c0_g3_i2:947-2971(+)